MMLPKNTQIQPNISKRETKIKATYHHPMWLVEL